MLQSGWQLLATILRPVKDADWFEVADKLHFHAFENINIGIPSTTKDESPVMYHAGNSKQSLISARAYVHVTHKMYSPPQ